MAVTRHLKSIVPITGTKKNMKYQDKASFKKANYFGTGIPNFMLTIRYRFLLTTICVAPEKLYFGRIFACPLC